MQDDRGVGHNAYLTVAITVELADSGFVEAWNERLVEDLYANHNVVVRGLCILLGDGREDLEGLRNGRTAGPGWIGEALSRIVEPVLRTWGAV